MSTSTIKFASRNNRCVDGKIIRLYRTGYAVSYVTKRGDYFYKFVPHSEVHEVSFGTEAPSPSISMYNGRKVTEGVFNFLQGDGCDVLLLGSCPINYGNLYLGNLTYDILPGTPTGYAVVEISVSDASNNVIICAQFFAIVASD